MDLQPLTRNYFSASPRIERRCRRLSLAGIFALTLVLYLFWGPLRSTELTYPFVSLTIYHPSMRWLSRFFSALGSEGFFLVAFSIVYWSLHKSLAFWGLIVMALSILVTSEIPKDLTRLPRPDISGVSAPTYTFPSGHTSGAVSVWGYVSVRAKKRWLWILSLMIVSLVGVSRVTLGYHFPGDVVGGVIAGVLFLTIIFSLTNSFVAMNPRPSLPFWLFVFLFVLGSFALSFMPVRLAPRLLGYFAGTVGGNFLQARYQPFSVVGTPKEHLLRAAIGLPPLAGIILGLAIFIPPRLTWLIYIQYFLATFWVTYLAPRIFVRLGIISRVD